jgi:acetyl-CoA carboxylase biotin carboxyl carrier protein
VLHLTPSPDEPPFVKLGDPVRAGQTLGVLEAMKMFHTLKSDHDGVVGAILVASGGEVEAGQSLFRIT